MSSCPNCHAALPPGFRPTCPACGARYHYRNGAWHVDSRTEQVSVLVAWWGNLLLAVRWQAVTGRM